MNLGRSLAGLSFPDRDETFDGLIRSLSEPQSGPHADNLMTNEDSFGRISGSLQRIVSPGNVFIGVGPDQNFTYIARSDPSIAFVLDYRRRNLRLHLFHKALFMLSDDRVSYLTRLTARRPAGLPPDPSADQLVEAFSANPFDEDVLERTRTEVIGLIRALGVLDDSEWDDLRTIQARLAGPGMNAKFLALPIYPSFGDLIRTPDRDGQPAHMLALEETYRTVRDAQRGDRVVPLVADLAGEGALPRLADWLRERQHAVSALYVSDVEFFLLKADRFEAYVANLDRLPKTDDAVIIRSSTREIVHPERVPGDSATTTIRPLSSFLNAAKQGRIRSPDDLFAQID